MRYRALVLALLAAATGCGRDGPREMSPEEVAAELSSMRIAPGRWELTSEVVDVRAPDLPLEVRGRMIGPRRRIVHCITPEQAARPGASFLAGRSDEACRYRDFRVADGRLSGAMTCAGAVAAMRGRYGPEGYDLRMAMESVMADGETMTLELRSRGRRIGECEEGQGRGG